MTGIKIQCPRCNGWAYFSYRETFPTQEQIVQRCGCDDGEK